MISETKNKPIGEGLSIEAGVPLGEVLSSGDVRVSVGRGLDNEQVQTIFRMIQLGFADHNRHSHIKQDMTFEEFEKEAKDPSVLKYVAENKDTAQLQGYLSVHSSMDDIVWADRGKLKALQAQLAPQELSFYVGTFVVPKELRGFKLSGALLEAALSQLINFNRQNGNRSLCFFDRSDSGSSAMREFVDRKLQKLTAGGPNFTVSEIDKVTYFRSAAEEGSVLESRGETPHGAEIIDVQHYYMIEPPKAPAQTVPA